MLSVNKSCTVLATIGTVGTISHAARRERLSHSQTEWLASGSLEGTRPLAPVENTFALDHDDAKHLCLGPRAALKRFAILAGSWMVPGPLEVRLNADAAGICAPAGDVPHGSGARRLVLTYA